ncbi:extracellular solute-binding protein [Lachnospiraceae bacterium 210521-DFI.5.20]|uniref:Extracellular solute-binding protein n=1 Tax=Fusicatenibacter saccharivorans TaxID=1150298 RepID=A0AAE3F0W7_9FIRM|nr:extracellular solute-binding protein [Fusicatenibacter saccharivorans]MCB6300400.1 extracellular solute-binding protein [Lachnospiraceae bacterium 210521-DFI.5.20]MCG4764096.1 extracellular solute-binding protein [Fusicatenibacter saccharivorans]
MKRKVVSLMLVSAMVAGMLAGCGSDSGSSKGGSSTETGSAAEASSSGETADDADDKSPITFEYFNADGKNGNWDNPVAKAITEATGVTLDVSYPVASQGDAKEDVALMIANDEYPDMIYAKGSATDLYQAGALIDMTDLIEKYGPNIKKMYGAEMEKLKWSQDDPGIYQLSYAGVNQKTLTTGGSCQIQWAALKENDYKYPKTLDEYEKMIKSYLAAHPKTDDGLDMIGITMSASDWHWMITLGNPAGLIADASPDNGQWIIDDEYNVHYKHVTDEEKEYFKWLCRMYNEGILDPNFATQTDDDYIAKVASGRVVAITDAEWHYSQCEATLVADGKVDQTYVGLPVTLREDQVEKALLYQGTTVGWGIGITKSCEDPVRAIKFLDYLCSDEGQILYHWGIEGENYFLDDDGQPYRTDEEVAKAQSDPDYAKNTGIDNYTGFPIYGTGSYSEDGFPYTPTTKESVIANYNTAEKEGCEAMGFEMLTDMFAQPEEFDLLPYSALWAYQQPQELAEKQTILDEIAWPGLVKCVTGTEDEFDGNWKSMVQELTDNGLADAEEAMTEFLATKLVDVE